MARRRKKRRRAGPVVKLLNSLLGNSAVLLLRLLRRFDRARMADRLGPLLRRIGPLLREHRTGRANLTAAFPDKSPEEI